MSKRTVCVAARGGGVVLGLYVSMHAVKSVASEMLDLQHGACVGDVPVRWDDEGHEFGAKSAHFAEVLKRHLEAHAAGGQFSIIDHDLPPVIQGPNEDASTLWARG